LSANTASSAASGIRSSKGPQIRHFRRVGWRHAHRFDIPVFAIHRYESAIGEKSLVALLHPARFTVGRAADVFDSPFNGRIDDGVPRAAAVMIVASMSGPRVPCTFKPDRFR
jgi:hypothetical protein